MFTQSRKKHTVPITILSDWWLILCVPLVILNVLMYVTRKTVLAGYFAAIRLLSNPVLKILSSFRLVNIPCIAAINVFLTLLSMAISLPVMHPVSILLIVMVLVTGMMFIQTAKMAIEFRDGNRTDLVLKFTVLHDKHWEPDNCPIPDALEVEKLSQGTWLGSIMVALFVICQFSMLLVSQTESLEFWLCVHALLLVSLLIDFEMVEHLAAHSRNGVLVKLTYVSPMAVTLYALEKIRIYFVWPMYYWAPGRYFLTHTHHHHVENNGPADWQSTLRFDLTSVADFSKSLLWLQSSLLMPVDTARYFWFLGRRRHFKKLILSSAQNLAVICFVFYLEPVFGAILFCLYLAMAWVFHSFVFAWHGFHDSTKPYDVVASNNSTGHYAHHKDPGMHLFSAELREIYNKDAAESKEAFPVHQSSVAFDVISKHWLLLQSLLWQKKYTVIRKLIKSDHLSDEQLHRLVTGMRLHERHSTIANIDNKLSKLLGSILEKSLLLMASSQHRSFLLAANT